MIPKYYGKKSQVKIPKYHKILSEFNRQGSLEVVVFKTPGFDNFRVLTVCIFTTIFELILTENRAASQFCSIGKHLLWERVLIVPETYMPCTQTDQFCKKKMKYSFLFK